MKITEGMHVRISRNHWARARQTGTVIEIQEDGRLVVEFDKEGIGFDGGKCLILRQEDFDSED